MFAPRDRTRDLPFPGVGILPTELPGPVPIREIDWNVSTKVFPREKATTLRTRNLQHISRTVQSTDLVGPALI